MAYPQINTKSIARIAAIQTLYQFASAQGEYSIESSLACVRGFYKDADFRFDNNIHQKSKLKLKPSYGYLEELVKYTHDNLQEIDQIISKHLTKEWKIDTIPVLLHAVLRVAICEIKYFPETPKKVILGEYTDIANDMLDQTEIGFVNSLLQTYSNTM